MGWKHELTKLEMIWTHFMGRKKGRLNANISLYLAIKYTTEVYIYVLIMLEISLITVIYIRE